MKYLKILLIGLFLILLSGESFSLPRFALRMGAQCIDCHVNPSGGNIRNTGGWYFSKNVLPLWSPRRDADLSNAIGSNIIFGVDYRTQFLVKTTDSTSRSDFQNMSGNIYTNISVAEKIDISARYDFVQQIWEAYGIAHILPGGGYLKFGQFQPNYGVRLDDHTAYTRGGDLGLLFSTGQRQGLIYDPFYTETGVEAGYYISDLALITASVGNPRGRLFAADPTYTGRVEFTPMIADVLALYFGGSYSKFRQQKFNQQTGQQTFPDAQMYGGFFGFSYDDLTVIGEYDFANNYIDTDSLSTAIMVEGSYRIMKGLEAVVRYDRFDPNIKINKDEVSRIIAGFEFFPYSFVELRPQYRIQMEEPSVSNNSFVLQFHFYY